LSFTSDSIEDKKQKELLRQIPAVDRLLLKAEELYPALPHFFLASAVKEELLNLRTEIREGSLQEVPEEEELLNNAAERVEKHLSSKLQRVINATGIVLHTNLGRSFLSQEAASALLRTAQSYTNLEFDLQTGQRGRRAPYLISLLKAVTGAEDALVVNNNAAAVLLCLKTLASAKEVIVSRGELIEIGGSFRLPEVMSQSGAILVEVGATNKTYLSDYEEAITAATVLLLKAHPSNYRILGFTEEVSLADLVKLAHRHQLYAMQDLGSGLLPDLSPFGIEGEPAVKAVLATGVDVVTISGDKLLGGPQAGIILGKKELLRQMARDPLFRAIRVDKLTVAALEATLELYLEPERALKEIPTLKMLTLKEEELQKRAQNFASHLQAKAKDAFEIEVIPSASEAGGGSLPLVALPTFLVALKSLRFSASRLSALLRQQKPPVIAFIRQEKVVFDLRTVKEEEEKELLDILVKIAEGRDFNE
jgi:L-seryl-tRNA(Ser) seleniumtransferase